MIKKKITRLYTGRDGESHFEDTEITLEDHGDRGHKSQPIKATGIIFMETGGDYYLDWHNVPQRQFSIGFEGKLEVEASDGTKRQFGPGDILLAEDTTGRGHINRAVGSKPRKNIFVTLD